MPTKPRFFGRFSAKTKLGVKEWTRHSAALGSFFARVRKKRTAWSCLVPEHNPLVLAKTVATVDQLSGGRFIFGAGVGWLAEEFEALDVPFDDQENPSPE